MMRGDLLTRVISSASEKSFSFAVKKKQEGIGKRKTLYFIRFEVTAFHAEREKRAANEKSSLCCAYEGRAFCDSTVLFYFQFSRSVV